MQPYPLLHEPFGRKRRIARFDADRGSSADAVEEFVAVKHGLHSKRRRELAIKGAGLIEAAHRQDDVSHAIYSDHVFALKPRKLA
jgi:hypothetical protein